MKIGWKIFKKTKEGYTGVYLMRRPYRTDDQGWVIPVSPKGYIFSPTRKIARQAMEKGRLEHFGEGQEYCIRKILYREEDVITQDKVKTFKIVENSRG
jgi:hypothetical protein